ncbi:unnamed protein product [Ostreobium quekettii]|uniref:UMP kinase n=1 Tax=Ostreobium quekettii TaxID=121088 RepID=A0A8S1J1Z6_9CHLO|nr:unnamed protein product [Ostreobium quekettii]
MDAHHHNSSYSVVDFLQELAEPYIRRRAIRHLEKDRVVIFGAGTGNPFFTTDTAASLRAAEINAEVFLKATKVDGIYTSDPMDDPAALLLEHLSYEDVQLQGLRVMDETAVTLCKENDIPVVILSISQPGNILKAIMGEPVGTLVDWRPTEAPRQPELVQLEANGAGLENSR